MGSISTLLQIVMMKRKAQEQNDEALVSSEKAKFI